MTIIQLLLLIVASLLVIESNVQYKSGIRSGLYYENEENQTVAYQFVSRRERRDLARNIFELLDLPIKPRGSRNKTLQTDVPASRFIRDVYSNTLGKQVRSFTFTNADLKTIEESDIILSYSALPKKDEHQSKTTLWFDVSETPKFSNPFRSELRVFVRPSINRAWKVSLYDAKGFVDSTKVTTKGWVKLNTGRVLSRWLDCSDCNRELHLSTVSLENDADDADVLILDDPKKQPFLVGYFVSTQRRPAHIIAPDIRSKRNPTSKAPRNYLDNPYSGVKENYRRRRTSCAVHSLHVRFSEFDFDRYIVEPDGFDARYCHGECRFPLTAHMNATNHALVQTLVHFIRPSLAPRVSCAPREYEHLPVFYSRDGDNFVYKIYREMIVKSCGCC